jgi:hypothetical protein
MVAKHLWPTIRREAIWTACKRHGARWALTYETSSDVTEICGKSLEALPSTSLTRKIERRLAKKQFVFESRVREAQVKFQMPTHLCEMVMANHYERLRSESVASSICGAMCISAVRGCDLQSSLPFIPSLIVSE